jgi:hypothetical protein
VDLKPSKRVTAAEFTLLAHLQAHLRGGQWVDLLPGGMPGPPESKWCQNRLRPYLCLGPEPDAAPGDQEAEEYIEVGLVLTERVLTGVIRIPNNPHFGHLMLH